MPRAGIVLSVGMALCAACSLTTSLDGYAGPPDPDPVVTDPDGGVAPDGDAAHVEVSTPLVVTSLALVSSQSEKTVSGYEVLVDGMMVPPTFTKWTLRAEVTGLPGSVVFEVDGAQINIENRTPYYMCGDNNFGGIAPCSPASGERVVRVTPHTGSDGTGASGKALTLKIIVP